METFENWKIGKLEDAIRMSRPKIYLHFLV